MGAGKDEGGKGDGDRLERASDILLRRQRGVVMVRCTSLMLSWAIVRKRGRRAIQRTGIGSLPELMLLALTGHL